MDIRYPEGLGRSVALGLVLALLAAVSQLAGCATATPPSPAPPAAAQPAAAEEAARPDIKEMWGIEIESIRLTSADYMVDFRYRVVDPEKAAPILKRDSKKEYLLIDEASGAKFTVPVGYGGALRQTTTFPKAGTVYFVMFTNPGKYVKKGSLVTVIIGDFKAEGLVVE